MKNEHDDGESVAVADTPDIQPIATPDVQPIATLHRHEVLEAVYAKASRGEQLSIDDIGIVGEMDKADYDANVTRLKTVLKYQPIAGSAADREAAKTALVDSQATLHNETPLIAAAISELRFRLEGLEKDVKAKAAVVAQQEDAVKRLRNCVPKHIEQYRSRQAAIFNAQPQFNRMRELGARATHIKSVLKLEIDWAPDNEKAVTHAQHGKRDDLLTSRDLRSNLKHYELHAANWVKYVAELQAELPNVEAEFEKLKAEYDAGMTKFGSVLDFYIPA